MVLIRYHGVGDEIFWRHSGDCAAMSGVERRKQDRIDRTVAPAMPSALQENVARYQRRLDRVANFLAHLPQQRAAFAIDEQSPLSVNLAMCDGAERTGEHREDDSRARRPRASAQSAWNPR